MSAGAMSTCRLEVTASHLDYAALRVDELRRLAGRDFLLANEPAMAPLHNMLRIGHIRTILGRYWTLLHATHEGSDSTVTQA